MRSGAAIPLHGHSYAGSHNDRPDWQLAVVIRKEPNLVVPVAELESGPRRFNAWATNILNRSGLYNCVLER